MKPGDSIMADCGFEIQDQWALINVKVNISPFLRGKSQFNSEELIETRRIASHIVCYHYTLLYFTIFFI